MSARSGQPGINANEYASYKFYIPKPTEQQKIADFLTAVDAKLQQLKHKNQLLEQYKKGCMQGLFSQALRFTQEDGSPYPAWEEKRLGDVFNERSERFQKEKELLSVTQNQGVVCASQLDRTISASADRSNYKCAYIGDIVYNSMRMWQGASGISMYDGIVSPAYTVCEPKGNQQSLYWSYYFKLDSMVHLFQRYSQGLTSDTWNLKFPAFSKIKVQVPHPDEQKKIADFLTALDAKIDLVAQQIEHTHAFKKGLLQQMFV